jgi:hypothetical protein
MSSEDLDEQAEELEDAGKAISRDEGRRSLKLWFAVLGSPIAWTGHLGANYSLEEWFACSRSAHHLGEILGIRVDVVSIMINTVMLAIAVLSGLAAYGCWKKLKGRDGEGQNGEGQNGEGQNGDDDTTERARWMAFAGIVEGALFTGIILLGYLPSFMIGICETTP